MKEFKKGKKILDIFFDGEYLNFDLRHSFPVKRLSSDLVRDIVSMSKNSMDIWRNGGFNDSSNEPVWMEFGILIEVDDDGNEIFKFTKIAKNLNNE